MREVPTKLADSPKKLDDVRHSDIVDCAVLVYFFFQMKLTVAWKLIKPNDPIATMMQPMKMLVSGRYAVHFPRW